MFILIVSFVTGSYYNSFLWEDLRMAEAAGNNINFTFGLIWQILNQILMTIFFITYCADMLALLVSAIAKTTTSAMTIMPFLLIIQLLFSGSVFELPKEAEAFTNLTATKWGVTALCSQGNYNSMPMVSVWNTALSMKDVEINGEKPLLELFRYMEQNGLRDDFLMQTAALNQIPEYSFDRGIVLNCWFWLLLWTIIYIAATIALLEFIDRDKR